MADESDVTEILESYLATFYVLSHVGSYLREIDIEVCYAMKLEALDERVCSLLQHLRDGLRAHKKRTIHIEKATLEILDLMPNEAE